MNPAIVLWESLSEEGFSKLNSALARYQIYIGALEVLIPRRINSVAELRTWLTYEADSTANDFVIKIREILKEIVLLCFEYGTTTVLTSLGEEMAKIPRPLFDLVTTGLLDDKEFLENLDRVIGSTFVELVLDRTERIRNGKQSS